MGVIVLAMYQYTKSIRCINVYMSIIAWFCVIISQIYSSSVSILVLCDMLPNTHTESNCQGWGRHGIFSRDVFKLVWVSVVMWWWLPYLVVNSCLQVCYVSFTCLSPVPRYVYKEEIQVRLQFLTWVFSMIGSPEGFRKSSCHMFLPLHTVFICYFTNYSNFVPRFFWFSLSIYIFSVLILRLTF